MCSQTQDSDRFLWDGKNFRPRFDADGRPYQPRAPGIPQSWEVGVGEPTVGGKVKLIGGRYRTLRDVQEPNERGWEPETLRPEPNPDVLEGEERVLAGKLTKMFPETFLESSGEVEEPPPVAPLVKPKLPFSLGSGTVGPSPATIEKVREVGHHDFEQKVKLLGLTGKWDTMRLLTAPPPEKDGGQSQDDDHWALRATAGTLLPAQSKPASLSTMHKKAGPWQTDYMANFHATSEEVGDLMNTKLRGQSLPAAGDGLSTALFYQTTEMDKPGEANPGAEYQQNEREECGQNETSNACGDGATARESAATLEGKDTQRFRSTRVPQPTFHSKMHTVRATG